MGSWGTALFSDDLAADVRADWRDAILDGAEPEDLTRRLVDRYAPGRSDDRDTLVFWMALAAAQMETGRLDRVVRNCALAIIDAGGDVATWREQDESLGRQRQKVLDCLAQKLRAPQPKPKRLLIIGCGAARRSASALTSVTPFSCEAPTAQQA